MKKGIYKHIKNTDVAIKVLNSLDLGSGYHLKVMWLNITNPKKVYIIDQDIVFIKKQHVNDWKRVYYP